MQLKRTRGREGDTWGCTVVRDRKKHIVKNKGTKQEERKAEARV